MCDEEKEEMQLKAKLYEKVARVKSGMQYLKRDGKSFGYKYVTGEQVLSVVNPLMAEVGLVIHPEVEEIEFPPHLVLHKENSHSKPLIETGCQLSMNMVITDTETGYSVKVGWAGAGHNDGEKSFGSALTYAERYFYLKFFGVATGEDDPDRHQKKYETQAAEAKGNMRGASAAKAAALSNDDAAALFTVAASVAGWNPKELDLIAGKVNEANGVASKALVASQKQAYIDAIYRKGLMNKGAEKADVMRLSGDSLVKEYNAR